MNNHSVVVLFFCDCCCCLAEQCLVEMLYWWWLWQHGLWYRYWIHYRSGQPEDCVSTFGIVLASSLLLAPPHSVLVVNLNRLSQSLMLHLVLIQLLAWRHSNVGNPSGCTNGTLYSATPGCQLFQFTCASTCVQNPPEHVMTLFNIFCSYPAQHIA